MRLKIKMGGRNMAMGATLDQLRAGLSAGMGRMGVAGQGSAGSLGSATPFGFFGSEKFGKPSRESKIAGPRTKGTSVAAAESPASVATLEELSAASDNGRSVTVKGGDRMMEEYRTLIEAYFRSLVDEK